MTARSTRDVRPSAASCRRLALLATVLAVTALAAPAARGQSAGDDVDRRTSTVEANGVRIVSRIDRVAYRWTVRNLDVEPVIVGFEIPVHHSGEMAAPPGWTHDLAGNVARFAAVDASDGLEPGDEIELIARAPGGPPVRAATATLVLADDSTIEVDGVWAPAPRPRSHVVLVLVILVAAAIVHGRRQRAAS